MWDLLHTIADTRSYDQVLIAWELIGSTRSTEGSPPPENERFKKFGNAW
jgi:hypothetical protein